MKKIKPDDYYNSGIFELSRFGKRIRVKNEMTEKQQLSLINEIKNQYDNLKSEIDAKIAEIKEDVLGCDPIQLLQFSSDMFKMQGIKLATSEAANGLATLSSNYNKPYIATEFIQSIFVSSPAICDIACNEDQSVFLKSCQILTAYWI